jgi:hypothetical protein
LADSINRRKENYKEEDIHKIGDADKAFQERTEGEHEYHGDEKEKEFANVDLGKWNFKMFGHTRIFLSVYLPD